MIERIKDLNGNEIIENCNVIIVNLQRGTFKDEDIDELNFQRDNFNYIITKNLKHIEIRTSHLLDSTKMFEEFLNFFELIFLFYGYFPKISKITVENNLGKIIPINKEKYLTYKYVTSNQHKKTYNKLIDINSISNLSQVISNWIALKNELGLCISGLLMAQMDDLKYIDVVNVVLLQSIDGYITNHIFSNLNRYDDENVTIFKEGSKNTKKIKNCSDDEKNSINFRNKLKLFIKDYGKIVLKNEYQKKNINVSFTNIKKFLNKCVNSRNRLSHMNVKNKENYFKGIENVYAFYKLLLIFRLNLIFDLNLRNNIIENNINLNIYYTDKWYVENLYKII